MTSIAPVVTLAPRDYDAVLFDLDGVLTRTASGLPCTFNFHGAWCSLEAGEFRRKVRFLGEIQKSVAPH